MVLFFVLSGFLISYSGHKPNNNWRKFLVDRLARLSSVVIPALLLTGVVCAAVIVAHHPEAGPLAQPSQTARYFVNAMYLQQVWFLCVSPGINGPFWSLGYEFWYYAFLGVVIFSKSWWRVSLLCAVAIFVGPKILLLFPTWWLGVFAERASQKSGLILPSIAWSVLFVCSLSAMLWLTFHPLTLPFWNDNMGRSPWYFSSNVIADTEFAVLVAINFFAGAKLKDARMFHTRMSNIVFQSLSAIFGRTFSLYLYHLPLMLFVSWFVPYDKNSVFHLIVACMGILVATASLAQITECQLRAWREWTNRFLSFGTNLGRALTRSLGPKNAGGL